MTAKLGNVKKESLNSAKKVAAVRKQTVGKLLIKKKGKLKKVTGWQWWKSIGSPQKVAAPLVNQSERCFREVVRRYGVDLCYTPMMLSHKVISDSNYRSAVCDILEGEGHIVAQLAGKSVDDICKAASLISSSCTAIDINLGCPQTIAKNGQYGAFMCDESAFEVIRRLSKELTCPVTAKIRIRQTPNETLQYLKSLVSSGVSMICIHGRLVSQRAIVPPHWDHVEEVLRMFASESGKTPVPIILNGGVTDMKSFQSVINIPHCAAVMSGEGLLINPTLFWIDDHSCHPAELYLKLCVDPTYSPSHISIPRKHIYYIFLHLWDRNVDLYDRLIATTEIEQLVDISKVVIKRTDDNHKHITEKQVPRKGGRPRRRTKAGHLVPPTIGGLGAADDGVTKMSEMRNLEWKTDVDPSVWTQCSKDENVSRAISRMTQSFEDVRVYLIQQLRAQEEATDAEIIKREEVERAREEDKEYYEALIAELEAKLEGMKEENDLLKLRLLDFEPTSPASPTSSVSPLTAADKAAQSAEEMEYLKEMCNEAETNLELAQAQIDELEAELEAERSSKKESLTKTEDHTSVLRMMGSFKIENDNLKQENRELQEALASLQSDFASMQRRYDKLQTLVNPVEKDPASEEVRQQAMSVSAEMAQKVNGKYDHDQPLLFDCFYDYEKLITSLNNEILSLKTIIKMREQDVHDDMLSRMQKERNDLLGRIAALEMR